MKCRFEYRVAILGAPSCPDVPWTEKNLNRLKELGFNAIQLNIAWGGRPADEPLNLEDVVSLPPERMKELNQPDLPPRSVAARRDERRQELHHRMALAKRLGFRTLFHFGAPFNAQYSGLDFEGPQARSLLDPETTIYYQELLSVFAEEYREVDDILVYTFDQDAWLTSEFGSCSRTRGIPLHERVVPFLEALAKIWRSFHPDGLLWWSPWELSGGQLFQCLETIDPAGIGLDLHSSVGEVIASMPVDRWLKNTASLAAERGMPVMCEAFLGAVCEETEPFQNLAHPPLIIRQVKAIASVPEVTALKEYYGLNPTKPDPNLEAASLAMMNPGMSEEEILSQLSGASDAAIRFWKLSAQAHEVFPWDASWWIRCLGLADVSHSLSAAIIRGESCATPSWCSTRAATFIKTDSAPAHPWMLECVQLRCAQAVRLVEQALEVGEGAVPDETLRETELLKEKIFAYVCHLRETNLAKVMRDFVEEGIEIPPRVIDEMDAVLSADLENQKRVRTQTPVSLVGSEWIWAAGKSTDEWLPFEPCRFRFEFTVRDGLKEALLCCASSENRVRISVNGSETLLSGVPPYTMGLGVKGVSNEMPTDNCRARTVENVGSPSADLASRHAAAGRSPTVPALQEGSNVIEAEVIRAGSLYNRQAFCARILLRYEDGTEEMMDSGSNWLADGAPAETVGLFTLDRYEHREWRAEDPPPIGFTGHCRQGDGGAAIGKALQLLQGDVSAFLQTYFLPTEDLRSRGHFSVTSC
jgi:hypothetical protein